MKFVLIAIISIALCACSTTNVSLPLSDNFEQVIEVPGTSKEDLYSKSNAWFVETFNSAESVIEFQDKEIGKIMGKHVWGYYDSFGNGFFYRFVVSVEVKENRYRLKFYDPTFLNKGVWKPLSNFSPALYRYHLETVGKRWEYLRTTLESRINENDDW